VPYRDFMIGAFKVTGSAKPAFFNGKLHKRFGAETVEVPVADNMWILQPLCWDWRFGLGREVERFGTVGDWGSMSSPEFAGQPVRGASLASQLSG
jgi:hypothetical protein